MKDMKQIASILFNNQKLTGGICASVTTAAPLSGVIKSRPLFSRKEKENGTDRDNSNPTE